MAESVVVSLGEQVEEQVEEPVEEQFDENQNDEEEEEEEVELPSDHCGEQRQLAAEELVASDQHALPSLAEDLQDLDEHEQHCLLLSEGGATPKHLAIF